MRHVFVRSLAAAALLGSAGLFASAPADADVQAYGNNVTAKLVPVVQTYSGGIPTL